jgi:hypothetical protein
LIAGRIPVLWGKYLFAAVAASGKVKGRSLYNYFFCKASVVLATKPKKLMKNLIIAIALSLLAFSACKKNNTPTVRLNEVVDTAKAVGAAGGNFKNGPYGSVSGQARIYNTEGKLQLAFEDFSSSNGPDLRVYLSKELNPVNFIDLGALKSTSGNQLYQINAGVAAGDYSYALIYCRKFKHLFGSAQLSN